jgi:hypothetical protein
MEACWNWGWLYDLLAKIEQVGEVVLAHPHKTRLIAEAQIKTDRLDAQMLAKLLRGDLIAQSHAPSPAPANTCYGSGSFGCGCAQCYAIAFTPCYIDSMIWNGRSSRSSLAGADRADSKKYNRPPPRTSRC